MRRSRRFDAAFGLLLVLALLYRIARPISIVEMVNNGWTAFFLSTHVLESRSGLLGLMNGVVNDIRGEISYWSVWTSFVFTLASVDLAPCVASTLYRTFHSASARASAERLGGGCDSESPACCLEGRRLHHFKPVAAAVQGSHQADRHR